MECNKLSLSEKLLTKAVWAGDCLIWTGQKCAKGYGRLRLGGRLQRSHRLIYELHHGEIPSGLVVMHSFDKPAAHFSYSNTGGANSEQKIHPTQKPIKLYEWLLTKYAKSGQRILDTHLGSGSSSIAAHNLGFDFVGTEISKDYFDSSMERLNRRMAQGSLFAPDVPQGGGQQADMLAAIEV